MKARILGIVLLMSLSTVLMSQTTENGPKKESRGQNREMHMKDGEKRGPFKELNLTEAQKESFKQSRLALQKQLQPLRNEVGEAFAHQKSLVTAEKPDIDAINKNIDKIGSLRIEMAKIHVANLLEMRAQLTDEQRMKFDLIMDKMKKGRGAKGIRQHEGWEPEQHGIE